MPERLTNAHSAWVPVEKMTQYLLNPLNPRAGTKPNDFAEMGYDTQNIEVLERDLISVAHNYPALDERTTPISVTYRVEGYVTTPTGAQRYIRTVWEITTDDPRPRLVTAYPVRQPQGG